VNGKKLDIASYLCRINDVIAVTEKSKNLVAIKASLESNAGTLAYVSVDKEKLSGVFTRLPERKELPQDINEAQIVEYYNRLL
jgi:small subunit ribosomal protein S4